MEIRVILDPQILDAPEVGLGRAAIGAVDRVTLAQQQFGEIGTVLAGDSGNNCNFHLFNSHKQFQNISKSAN
jgi:hypothetical protein